MHVSPAALASLPDRALRAVSPRFRAKRKYEGEIKFWRQMRADLLDWFTGKRPDYWGVILPERPAHQSPIPLTNAIQTMHDVRPLYLEALQIERDHFTGQRVLEVGCGPLVPALVFSDCELHALDPLNSLYQDAGFPLFDLPATCVTAGAEAMPYPDAYFDSVLSVNALDHVDDFEQTAREMQRVLKPGGGLYVEVEYHAQPTLTEPVAVTDDRMRSAFSGCALTRVTERTARQMFATVVERFHLKPTPGTWAVFDEDTLFVTWHGRKR